MANGTFTEQELEELFASAPTVGPDTGVFEDDELADLFSSARSADAPSVDSPLQVQDERAGFEAFMSGALDSPLQNVLRGTANVAAEGIRRADAAVSGREREAVPFGNVFTGQEGSLFAGSSQFDVAPGTEGFAQIGRAASGGIEILMGSLGGGGQLLARTSTAGSSGAVVGPMSRQQVESALATRISNRNVLTNRQLNILAENPQMLGKYRRGTLRTIRRAGGFFDNLPDTMLLRMMQNPRGVAGEEVAATIGGIGVGTLVTNIVAGSNEGPIESTALAGDLGTLAGNVFSPAAAGANVVRVGIPKMINRIKSFFGKGPSANVDAALAVRELATALGRDPEELLKRMDTKLAELEAAGVKGAERLPPDILLGDDFLGTLRANLGSDLPAEINKNLKQAGARDIDEFSGGLVKLARRLRETGDPELTEMAVVAEREAVLGMMEDQEMVAFGRLQRTFAEIFPEDVPLGATTSDTLANLTERRAQAGIKVHETLEDALEQVNKIDAQLWQDFGKGITVKPQGLQPVADALEQIGVEVGPGGAGRIPRIGDISKFLEEGATVPQLVRLRSDLLAEGRRLRSQQLFPSARDVSNVADGIDKILLAIGGDELNMMRQFTAAKKDMFTRSFGGRVLSTDREGANKIRPQDILEMAVKFKSTDRVAVEFSELQEAGVFGDLAAGISGGRSEALDVLRAENRFNQATGGSISRREFMEGILGFDTPMGSDIMHEGRTFLRSAMSSFVDEDGNLDAAKFSTFIRNNASTIRNIGGGLKELVSDTNLARRIYRDMVADNEVQSKSLLQRRVFAEITGSKGNPTIRIKPLLANGLQPEDFDAFLTAARNGEERGVEGAVEGYKATLLKAAEEMAEDSGGDFSWHKFDSVLNSSGRNRPSVVEQMQRSGMIDEAGAERLQTMIDIGKRTELDFADPEVALSLGFGKAEPDSMFENLALGAVGSVAATTAANRIGLLDGAGAGPSLVVAQGGASIARALLNKTLDDNVHIALMRGLNSAEDFKTMMTAVNPDNFRRVYNKINSMAIAAGFDNLGDFDLTIPEVQQEMEETARQFNLIPDDELPEIPEPVEEPIPVDEPDFFEQLRGGQ